MSCSSGAAVCCGSKRETVQDCVECRWLVFDQTPQTIYRANEIVSASGTFEGSSNTTGMTQVTVTFSIGTTAVTSFTLNNRQCMTFTVVGFDTITLLGNAASPSDSAAGSLCLTTRYQVF